MPRASSDDLLIISKSSKEKLDALAFGAHLAKRTGYDLSQLRSKAAADRVDLARSLLRDALEAAQLGTPRYRTAVSRAYYAMYHALRAATYIAHGGDDHEQHTTLPGKIPNDFPDRTRWENALKNARYERNRADYDPYPRIEKNFEHAAQTLVAAATELLPLVRGYLRRKQS